MRRTMAIAALAALALAGAAKAQDHHGMAEAAAPNGATTPVMQHAPEAHASEAHGANHGHDDGIVPPTPTLLPGYGNGGFAITTTVPQAQAFFSNGMELGAAFAHEAAIAAMKEAVWLDPGCAMCKWGQALVAGPTINFTKTADERKPLLKLATEAADLAQKHGTAKERDLTAALVLRYQPGGKPVDHDKAYANAMRALAARYPQDNELLVLTADAIMVESTDFGARHREAELAAEASALLEKVLARAPDHTPAIHFYIHASETIDKPQQAEPFADRLASLAPNASHLVHMPSHTFYWLGRYQDAADTNWRAVEIGKADAKRLGVAAPHGVWGLGYHAHNVIFGLGGALMAGDSRSALSLARPLVERAQAQADADPFEQLMSAAGYFALARFDDPASVLALPEPKTPYLKAARHYARGEALVWQGDLVGAKAELAAIQAKVVIGEIDKDHRAPEQMLGITRAVLEGRLAMAEHRYADAVKAFTTAAEIEETPDFRRFSDPPAFWYEVRRDVAAACLAMGDKAGARQAAEAALKLRPRDAVAIALLAKAGVPLEHDRL